MSVAWDGSEGTAGGSGFGAALQALAAERGFDAVNLGSAVSMPAHWVESVFAGRRRVTVPVLARFAQALGLRAIEFLQRAGLLSLEVYALGLDPLYFLPPGQVRHDARIYMREINPRHAVPERDMLVRNPTLKALLGDEVLDAAGKLEVELTYLLRAAVQNTGGTL
ncbi:MAG: helix-turn-helix domain-containing protein [Candidatus Baltobacteraceae bacterium]